MHTYKLFSNNSAPPVSRVFNASLLTEGMFTIKDDISGHFQSFDFRISEEIKYCLRHNLPRAHLGLARLVANWLVGWWLWRATCISQDTYLLYFMYLQISRCISGWMTLYMPMAQYITAKVIATTGLTKCAKIVACRSLRSVFAPCSSAFLAIS